MTPLRQQMLDAMVVRGLAARTQEAYVDSLGRMARYFKRSPADLTAREIEAYMLHLAKERRLSFSSVNQVAAASRFLFTHVLAQPDWVSECCPRWHAHRNGSLNCWHASKSRSCSLTATPR